MKRMIKIGIVVVSSLICQQLAFAQMIPLDTISDRKELKTVVITGQFVPTDSRNTVNSVRTIDQKTIASRAVVNLEELLSTEANLRISQDGVFGSAIKINGLLGENVKILVDGVPVMGRLNGSVDAGQLPLSAVRQVEIIEGAQSLMYGSEASAGVINLITQRSQAHKAEADVTGQFETNGFRSVQARTGLRAGKWYVQASGNLLEFMPAGDTLRNQPWNPKLQKSGRGLIRYSAGDAIDIRLSGSMFNEHVDNLGEMRRPTYKPYAFDDIYVTDRNDVTLHAEGWLKNRSYFWQATSGINDFYRVRNSYRYDFENDSLSLLPEQQDTSGARGILHRATFASDYKNARFNALIGAEHFTEYAEGVRIVDTTRNLSGMAINRDLGIFGSLKWQPIAQFTLQGGARFTTNQLYGSVITPSVWSVWQPSSRLRVKASYANGFRSPGLKELYFQFIDVNHFIVGNQNLLPERSHNFRTDVNYELVNTSKYGLQTNVSGFYNDIDNRIILAEFAPVQYSYENVANWRTAGFGLTLTGRIGESVSMRSALVMTGFYNLTSEERPELEQLIWSPDWVNEFTYRFIKANTSVHIWHKLTGKTPYYITKDKELNEGNIAAWSLLNASVSTSFFKEMFTLNTGVKNILDKRNIETRISDGIHSPIALSRPIHWGRTFFVSLSCKLKK